MVKVWSEEHLPRPTLGCLLKCRRALPPLPAAVSTRAPATGPGGKAYKLFTGLWKHLSPEDEKSTGHRIYKENGKIKINKCFFKCLESVTAECPTSQFTPAVPCPSCSVWDADGSSCVPRHGVAAPQSEPLAPSRLRQSEPCGVGPGTWGALPASLRFPLCRLRGRHGGTRAARGGRQAPHRKNLQGTYDDNKTRKGNGLGPTPGLLDKLTWGGAWKSSVTQSSPG